jgi:methylase of polypeptide subunit release factors
LSTTSVIEKPEVSWNEKGALRTARWQSDGGVSPPKRVVIADDRTTADIAYRHACEGTALLWRGDFQNARQLLQALARRADMPRAKKRAASHDKKKRGATPGDDKPDAARKPGKSTTAFPEAFHQYRMAQAQRARILGMLLLPFTAEHQVPLPRAPDVSLACAEAHGSCDAPYLASMRELLGLIGAHEWRKKGVEIRALDARIHPHYGVFSPVRGEYLDLVAEEPLPDALGNFPLALDIGTGTGVLAAILARRGVAKIIATENDARALICARENIARLELQSQVEVVDADLFPEVRSPDRRAALAVCNPPWLPGKPGSAIEHAVYDPDSRMLLGFLNGLAAHLAPGGEGWLILSDLAEHLGLRSREQLLEMIAKAHLQVLGRRDIRPRHARAQDVEDPLHKARAAEMTSLWRLGSV